MSNTPPSPLAEKAAELRRMALATPAPCWLPHAVHTLILSLLARIFARLEDMIALWAQGLLPPPPPAREPRAHVEHPRRTPSARRRTPLMSTPRPHAPRVRQVGEQRPFRIRIWWSRNRGARRTFALAPTRARSTRPRPKRDPPALQRA